MHTANPRKEKQRYYLLAGMGGKPARRRHFVFLAWALAAGLVVSVLLALTLRLTNGL